MGFWFLVRRLLALVALSPLVVGAEEDFAAQAKALHQRIVALDAHVDIPFEFATAAADPGEDSGMQFDLPKLERGGQAGAVLAVFVPQQARDGAGYQEAKAGGRQKLAAIKRMAANYPSRIEIAYSVSDIQRIHAAGNRFAVIGMLNGFSLGPDGELLGDYYAQGLRQFGFTHAGNNDLADSSRPSARLGQQGPEHQGLSAVGKGLVGRLNDKGIIIDVSQLTPAGVEQICKLSRAPVIASHSAARARIDHPRNLTDREMRMIAATGGVVHIVAFGSYLRDFPFSYATEVAKIRKQYGADDEAALDQLSDEQRARFDADVKAMTANSPKATVSDYVDILEYAISVVGVDHVGISSDFGHGGGVTGWMNSGESYNVTAQLLRRGYSEEDIAKLWGGNWLRVFKEVETVAATNS